MLSKKKKIFVLVGMVALLVVTGCLNIFLNAKVTDANAGNVDYGNYFTSFRNERKATRDQTMLYLDAIINNQASSEEAIKDAQAQKLELTKNMEVELVLEGLIKALGFEEAVVTNTTENVNIIIKSKELTSDQVAQVLELVVTETEKTAGNVRIIPVE